MRATGQVAGRFAVVGGNWGVNGMHLTLPGRMVWALGAIAALIAADTLLGWIVAIRTHTWQWARAGQWLQTNVLGYLGGGLVTAVLAQLHPSLTSLLSPVFWTGAASVAAKFLLGDLREKIQQLLGAAHPAQTR